jgi:DNA recombination protein RmuC
LFFINRKLSEINKPRTDEALLEWLKSMHSSNNMVKTLQENSKQLNERLDKAALAMRDVGKEVGEMNEIGRNMKELQEFLKSPKLRGNIGEQVLKDLISQMFPKNSFNLQYEFKSGEKVDAAIKTEAGILPIDSKFPMENFQKILKTEGKERENFQKEFVRDVKKHIDSISRKYILPQEGTMDFALMYVPSESVYYEVVNETDLMEYARKARVYIVSPSTLYAHLQTILLSFEGKKIEERSKEIFTMLRSLQIDYGKVNDSMGVLGKHLNNAYSQFNNVTSGFGEIGQKLNSTKNITEKIQKETDE